MNRISLVIQLLLVILLALPAIPLDHLLLPDVQAEAASHEADGCGCPSQERSHEHSDTTGDCDSDCHCTCHLTLSAALLHFDDTCVEACVSIAAPLSLLPPSRPLSRLERPPRS